MSTKKPSKKKPSKKKPSQKWLEAEKTFATAKASLLRRKGVVGVSLGVTPNKKSADRTFPVIRVHVEEKLAPEQARKAGRMLPEKIGKVPLKVIEATYSAQACLQSAELRRVLRSRLQGGIAIAPRGGDTFGTLGAIVADSSQQEYILTAEHVVGPVNGEVTQPLGGQQVVGRVQEGRRNPQMDAAIVKTSGARPTQGGVWNNRAISGVVAEADIRPLPFAVEVIGSCSGTTFGEIDSVDATMQVAYPGGSIILFQNQMHLVRTSPSSEISRGGDSGSLVLKRGTNLVVGLLFAGESEGPDFALATPIQRILEKFKVTFV